MPHHPYLPLGGPLPLFHHYMATLLPLVSCQCKVTSPRSDPLLSESKLGLVGARDGFER